MSGKIDIATDFSAADARVIAKDFQDRGNVESTKILLSMLTSIKRAAEQGHMEVVFQPGFYSPYEKSIIHQLRLRGFTAELGGNQHDGSHMIVSF